MSYKIHMKRTNLVLDADLLEEATRELGVKTYSAAVNTALAELLRLRKILRLPSFFNQGLWQGDPIRNETRPERTCRKESTPEKTVILVDTSVWIEMLNGRLGSKISERELLQFRTCTPVVQEVLQGLRDDQRSNAFRQSF